MHHGILSCRGDAPLGEVVGIMAEHRVHAVAERVARQTAATRPFAVSAAESLYRVARLMAEHGVVHDAASGYPTGIPSTLDITAPYANGSEVSTLDGAKREGRMAR